MPRVIGIDLSLTSTGLAVIDSGSITTYTVKSNPIGSGIDDHLVRCRKIARRIAEITGMTFKDLVAIEGLSYHSKSSSLDRVFGGWWLVNQALMEFLDEEPIVVPPTSRSLYATGNGNASKDAVTISVAQMFPDLTLRNNDEADAVVIARMGARLLGEPIDDPMPASHLKAMKAIPGWKSLQRIAASDAVH